jgi:hypothetical protein
MVCSATLNVVSSAPTSRRTYNFAATLTPDGPIKIIIDFVTPKINTFLSDLLSLPLPSRDWDEVRESLRGDCEPPGGSKNAYTSPRRTSWGRGGKDL